MTAPSYTTDLLLVDDAEDEATWFESTDGGWDDSQSGPENETDYYIADVGSLVDPQCISCTTTKIGVNSMISNGGPGSWIVSYHAFVWQYFGAPNALDTYANGGQRVIGGTSLGDFYAWKTGGSDRSPNPYGGWKNVACNLSYLTADYTVGSPGGSRPYIGGATKTLVGIAKGYPMGMDVIRYGNGTLIVEYGEVADYATFAGMAAENDDETNRWGLFQAVAGGYLQKGLLQLGTVSNAVDMRDSNVVVTVDDTPKAWVSFNGIDVGHADSNVEWENVSYKVLGTQSPGTFLNASGSTIAWTGCKFEGWGRTTTYPGFRFQGANVTVVNCIFISCSNLDCQGAVDLTGTKLLTSNIVADESALDWDSTTDPDGLLDNMTFSKGANAHHAIEFGPLSPTTLNLNGITFTDFNAADNENDSTFYIARGSGTVTINLSSCTGNFTYKSAGATVVINEDEVTLTVTALDADDQTAIENALVTLYKETGASITSITRAGDVATVTQTGHGYSTNDWVAIKGCTRPTYAAYNGVHQITWLSVDTYSFPVFGSPATPALGTKTAHLCYIHELTNASGIASETLPYSADIDVEGRVTKGTRDPRYKPSPLSGKITTSGFVQTAFMQPD